jgi:hypothetical protein
MKPEALNGLPEIGVTLAGTPDRPIIVNHTQRRVIVYVLQFESRDPQTGAYSPHSVVVTNAVLHIRNGYKDEQTSIPAGASRPYPNHSMGYPSDAPIARASLDSVVFEDGEFAGPDAMRMYEFISTSNNLQGEMYRAVTRDHASGKMLAETMGDWSSRPEMSNRHVRHQIEGFKKELERVAAHSDAVYEQIETWANRMVVIYRKEGITK